MEARAGKLREQDIAGHHHVLGAGGNAAQAQPHGLVALVHVAAGAEVQVFAMIDDGQVEGAGEFHSAAHHARVHHRAAIVGDGHHTRGFHGADGRQLFARAVFGDGADGEDVSHGKLAGAFDDVAGDGGIVVHRQRVGHAADGGEAAGGRGARAGLDGFGVLEARLAQVHVHVDEAGSYDQAGGIEDLRAARGFEIGADGGDDAVANENIG